MTTNVYDGAAGMLTTDSRWSVTYGKYVVYVDDARFEKLECFGDTVFMFAGKGAAIQQWKTWIRSSPGDDSQMPPHDGMSVCVVDANTNTVLFSARQDIVKEGAYFTGSGSIHAATCWTTNRCALRAIETAKERDFYTGGEVKFFNTKTRENNLYAPTNEVTMDMVRHAINERGVVMELATNKGLSPPFKRLPDLAANDAELQDLSGKLANGELQPEAPCDGMISEWSEDQKSKLSAVLGKVFGWK
ncbi:hypothetical protein J2789_007297 [Variovorax paradoxus]|uniref:hypothetical protein n=1 Tax=Variovorax atrisoli TaxID=3394203 RepID=UPI0011A71A05|nr:hypothetical protein [Variovorax paradoxus]MDR6524581.1 hypothetical protein [Variovorax paradoxus]